MKNSALLAASLLMAALALTGCSGDQATAPAPQAPEVTVAHPLNQEIVDWDDYVGKFQAVQTVDIRPRVSGYLTKVHFEDGQLVKAGDVLFTIDQRPFKAQLAAAQAEVARVQANLKNLQVELDRQRKLVENGNVSQSRFDTAQADVLAAEAGLKAAQANADVAALNVGFAEVKAPADGRVSYRRVDVGNAVKADDTLLTRLVTVDPIYFVFDGSEALYLKYKRDMQAGSEGAAVRIRLQDEADYNWKGHLNFMDAMLDGSSGTIRGRAVIDNPDGFLIPGMFGHMQLQGSEPYKGILIPDTAVTTIAGNRAVYVVGADNKIVSKIVELGPINSGFRVIRSGLTPQDTVVVDGLQRVRPGIEVTPVSKPLEAPASLAANLPSGQ
jgi:RND family efflux transporter MFP subunit